MTSLRFFVTGTDTGVGKTEVSCALLSLLVDAGLAPFAFKPVESGGSARTGDAARLRQAAGGTQPPETVCLQRFKAPLAPALAARLEGKTVSLGRIRAGFRAFGARPGVVEGAGGLHVPLTDKADVIDLIEALALPVVLVARAGLGTLNHTTLSLEALLARGLRVAAVVLTQSTPAKDPATPWNRPELERRFPRVRFLGPVPYLRDARRRQAALRRTLRPLLQQG